MIIIETPAPPTRERLVLVPLDTVSREAGAELLTIRTANARDATPDDLARAGYVLRGGREDLDCVISDLTAQVREAEARAEKAEAHIKGLHDAEHDTRGILDAVLGEPTADAATRLHNDWVDTRERAEKVERERDEARAELADAKNECAGAMRSAHAQYAETVRQRDTLRAELARLTAPAEGEPTDEALRDAFEVAYRDAPSECCHANAIRAIYRLGVAHERARQQPAQDRATDELERVYSAAYARAWESEVSTPDRGERAGLRAVAAHVRQERCLVARVVSASMSMHVYRRGHDGWAVALGPRFVECERADVPATLARLLGEVSR